MSPSSRGRLALAVALCSTSLLFLLRDADSDPGAWTRTYDPGDLSVSPGPDGLRVTWDGLPALQDPGRPALPVDRITVEAPAGMRLAGIEVRATAWKRVPAPEPPAHFAGTRPSAEHPVLRDDAVYASPLGFPETAGRLTPGGYFRGRRIETVELFPVRYLGEAGVFEVAAGFQVTPRYEPDTVEPVRSARGPWEPEDRFSRAVERITGADGPVAPVRDRGTFRPLVNGQDPFSPRFLPSEEGSAVRYVIITTDAMQASFQKLANWKTALGMPTVVRTVSWIESNYPRGVDRVEDVRTFIREAVNRWGTEFVLVGGDVELVPIRFAKTYFYGGEFIPTDLYLSCLDGSWNADGDQLYGEAYFNPTYPGDGVDMYPDVWVGRAPVRDSTEAARFVNKVITYESAAPLGSSFGPTMLSLGEMLFPQNWSPGDTVLFDGAALCETAVNLANGGTAHYRMYENQAPYPGSVLLSRPAALAQMNAGHNLILHVGHGYRNNMALGYNGESMTNADADALYNLSRQGALYAINCTSAALDYDCIAEHLMRNPFGGVLALNGSTRLDWPNTGSNYQSEFFELVFQTGVTKLGEASALQKVPYVPNASYDSEHRWTQFNLIYLGDPDLDLHTGSIAALNVNVVEPLQLGQGLYTVQVTDGGGPVEGAVVCLNKAGDAYGYAVTGPGGTAVVAFDPDATGKASLGVRAHNHRSRVDSVMVGAPAGVHLAVTGLTVDDSSGGDGDGALEAGETAHLYPTVSNRGLGGATGVSATLVSPPAGISIVDGNAAVPNLGAGVSAPASDPWTVSVAASVPDVSALSFGVDLAAAAYARQDPLVLYVGAPDIRIFSSAVRDTIGNGNGNGVIQAFEDQHLRVYVRNWGVGDSFALTGSLSTTDPAVTITDNAASYGNVGPGQVAGGDGFAFRFSDTNLSHQFTVSFTDQRGLFLSRKITVQPPAVPGNLVALGEAKAIDLTWDKVADADLWGYHVFRSANPAGPFARITGTPIGRFAYYIDEGLPSLTRYYYKVAAVDSSGNQGGMTGVASATTSLPSHTGFPMPLNATAGSSPGLAYLNGDSRAELIAGGDEIYVVTEAGEEHIDGDQSAQTYGVFAETNFGPYWSPPATGDMDGDGITEIASATWHTGFLYIWDTYGNVKPGWPRSLNPDLGAAPSVWGAPALADVDGDGFDEVFINADNYVMAFNHDGTELVDGDANPATAGVFLVMNAPSNYSTPALADIDNDQDLEVIVGSRDGKLYVTHANGTAYPGFPFATAGEITNSPAVGDLDKDGLPEIVFASSNLTVYALNKNLVQPPGWPRAANMNQDLDASPAIADMDGDTFPDVILCAGNGTVYIWRGQNGAFFPGFPKILYDSNGQKLGISSSPAVGNIDGDPGLEFVFGGFDGNVYAFNPDGTDVDGFPIGTANRIDGGALIWDIDDDGLSEIAIQSLDGNLYVWDSPGTFDPGYQPWPMFHQNSRRTGVMSDPVWIVVGTPEQPGVPVPFLANRPNPFRSATRVLYRVPPGAERVDLSVYDVQGRLIRTLSRGAGEPGDHEVEFDGRDDQGTRLGPGVYFYRLTIDDASWTRKLVLVR